MLYPTMRAVCSVLLVTFLATLPGCFGRIARYGDEPAQQPGYDLSGLYFEPDRGQIPTDRVVAFILATNPYLKLDEARLQAETMHTQASKHGVPVHLLVSLIATESSFNPRAVSPVGAQGLGQLMPPTARDMGITDSFDVQQNIFATARYLAWLEARWRSHPRRWELVLASYLAGIGTVQRQLQQGRELTEEQRRYVSKIFRLSGRV